MTSKIVFLHRANEETKMMMNVHQKIMESNLEMMQTYSQFYFDFIVKATQQSLDQSLAMQAQLSKAFEANIKRTHEVMSAEQELMMEAVEAFQAQSQAAVERFTQLFIPNCK